MTTSEHSHPTLTATVQKVLVALCAAGTILLIGWLFKYSAYGIDFTDESFYLVWIANPFIYNGSITQFGFIYHPIYSLLGGDIAALRQANILITFGLTWGFVHIFLTSLAPNIKEQNIILLTASAGFATSAFILFYSWLPTPSYNSLNLQGLLITATGLVLAQKNADRKSITGWLLIGAGGWLVFMAKPSTALALAVGVSIYLLLARKLSVRMLALTTTCALALILASALLIDGSVAGFVKRVQLGIDFTKIHGGGYSASQILRIDKFQTGTRLKIAIFLASCALLLASWSMCAKNKKWSLAGLLISITFFAITALLTLGQINRTAELGHFQGLLIFSVTYSSAITALALGRLQTLKGVSSQQWTIAALFLAMPHIYAFGTNVNYWRAGGSAAIFWLLSGLTLLGPLIRERASWLLALPLAIATQAVTATLLQTGLEQPYRQPQPLRLNSSILEIGQKNSPLVLSQGYKEYITKAVSVAREAGFESNTPVIDLTGQSPGILFALGAESIGQGWTIGGYPGSLNLAKAALSTTSCKNIAEAWILHEPNGPRSIPTEIMPSLGTDFPDGYDKVGVFYTADGAGGYAGHRIQELYRPHGIQQKLIACERLRAKEPK